jgi:nucleotide-binding universal stress UspA family protein
VVSVVRPPEVAGSAADAVLKEGRDYFSQAFKSIASAAAEHDIEMESDVVAGDPAEQIIAKAQSSGSGLVLVGRRGTSKSDRWALGATAERVLRYAQCPVMVVN